ncbi:MAG TPA: hypothetical protein VFK05_32255 [Polyangiaceae bacterium]|nr:hypothetical protein [Polyangiaceae bacterium]
MAVRTLCARTGRLVAAGPAFSVSVSSLMGPAAGQRFVAEAESAGVPHGDVAKKHGVTLATLKYHLYKARGAGKKKTRAPRMLPVRLVTEGAAAVETQRVSFRDGCDPAYVVTVLGALNIHVGMTTPESLGSKQT